MKSTLKANSIKQTIVYLHLLSFLPIDKLAIFKRDSASVLKNLADQNGLSEKKFIELALPEACYRIVTFHQATREPAPELVKSLLEAAMNAEKNAKSLAVFKQEMILVSALPGRARAENRLHRNKGCRYCSVPCQYGFFTLVSDPNFSRLQTFLAAESQKPASTQTPLLPVYLFTIEHLINLTGSQDGYFERNQVANLSFCLLMLALAKSRLAFPDAHVRLFQNANQQFILQTTSEKIT
jgi:hypothetical protein